MLTKSLSCTQRARGVYAFLLSAVFLILSGASAASAQYPTGTSLWDGVANCSETYNTGLGGCAWTYVGCVASYYPHSPSEQCVNVYGQCAYQKISSWYDCFSAVRGFGGDSGLACDEARGRLDNCYVNLNSCLYDAYSEEPAQTCYEIAAACRSASGIDLCQ